MRAKSLWLGLSLTVVAVHARADEVHLAGGRTIEGVATHQGDKVVITLESGSITVPSAEVLRIDKGVAPLAQVEEREAKLAADDRAGILKLADYCRDHELPAKERELLLRLIAHEPDHPAARRRLGYVRTQDGWVERSELAQKRAELSVAQRLAELEVAQKRAELSLTEARAAREREKPKSEPRAEAPPHTPVHGQPYYPSVPYYPPPAVLLGPHPSQPIVPPFAAPMPPPNYAINGMITPQSFIDDMQRSMQPPRR